MTANCHPVQREKTAFNPFFFPFLSQIGGVVRFAMTWQTCPMVVEGQTRRPAETPRRCFWLRGNSAPRPVRKGDGTVNDMKSMNKVFGACAPPRLVIGTPHNGVRGRAPPTMPFTLFTVKHHTPGQRTPLPQSAPLAGWREATDRTSALRRFSALTSVAPRSERGMKGNGSQPPFSQNRELTKFGHTPPAR